MKNKKDTSNFWRATQVIIMIITFAFALWQHLEKEKYRITAEIATSESVKLLEQVFQLSAQIRVHEKNEKAWEKEKDELQETQKADRLQAEKYYQQSMIYRHETEKLRAILDDIIILDMDDDEHLRFFRQWAKQ